MEKQIFDCMECGYEWEAKEPDFCPHCQCCNFATNNELVEEYNKQINRWKHLKGWLKNQIKIVNSGEYSKYTGYGIRTQRVIEKMELLEGKRDE